MSLEMNLDDFETLLLTRDETSVGETSQLIVYNDDFNTFDWVIECFIDILHHSNTQAEQLSLMVHFKGKASVKTAPLDVLKPLKDALIDRGLSAAIDTFCDK